MVLPRVVTWATGQAQWARAVESKLDSLTAAVVRLSDDAKRVTRAGSVLAQTVAFAQASGGSVWRIATTATSFTISRTGLPALMTYTAAQGDSPEDVVFRVNGKTISLDSIMVRLNALDGL